MDRSEKLIEYGDSWFSPKCIEVQPQAVNVTEVELLDGRGGECSYRLQPNSECRYGIPGSETASEKIRRREGKNPDRQLRSRSAG